VGATSRGASAAAGIDTHRGREEPAAGARWGFALQTLGVDAFFKWRVLGPLSNIPDFYEAFDVRPGQPMWRAAAQRVSI
jgi:hypothetical protein